MTIRNATLAAIAVATLGIAAASTANASMGKYGGMMGAADKDKDGVVSCSEYKAMKAEKFKKFDTNNDGGLTAEEIIAGREAMKVERMKAYVAKADTDKNGKISMEEFENFSKSRHGGKMHKSSSRHDKHGYDDDDHRKGKKYGWKKMHNKYSVCD